jgi:transcriptional regulator with XRE-family HTH domain
MWEKSLAQDDGMDFGKRLKELRIKARLSQPVLARLSGVSTASIGLLERGLNKPRPETLQMLAQGLATDTDGAVNIQREQELFLDLYQAAGLPLPRSVTQAKHQGLDALLRDYPELRAELALLLHGNPSKADMDFLTQYVRLSRERNTSLS